MAEALIEIEGLAQRFGGVVAADGISLTVAAGELHAIIGPNGAVGPEQSARFVQVLLTHKGEVTVLLIEHDMAAVREAYLGEGAIDA